jgi:hypothetical protein
MEAKYKFGHRPARRRRTRFLISLGITLLIVGVVTSIVWLDIRSNQAEPVQGASHEVAQLLDEDNNVKKIDEPTFTMELPSDWKQTERVQNARENSVTWQATKAHEDNRYLTVYVDIIPKTKAVTRMLVLSAQGNGLVVGEASSNCSTFTKHGDGSGRQDQDEPAKWQGLNFICDLGRSIDNEIGTGSTDGINTIAVTGPTKGKHNYFFVYTDHNIQPNTTIFYDALKSFKAK